MDLLSFRVDLRPEDLMAEARNGSQGEEGAVARFQQRYRGRHAPPDSGVPGPSSL